MAPPIVTKLVAPVAKVIAPVPKPLLFGLTIAVILAAFAGISGVTVLQQAQASPCGISAAQVAFCDTFDAPSPNGAGTRAGDMDGVVWGVSRATSSDFPNAGRMYDWPTTTLNRCGVNVTVGPERDVQICNGRLVEAFSDRGAFAVLAMYPRQPFDIAGRTGKVAFDVTNDTEGTHMAWPEFVYTDQPVPAPTHEGAGVSNFAKNSFGVSMAASCQNGANVVDGTGDSWAVDSVWVTRNYQFAQVPFTRGMCIKKAPGPNGPMNHVEILMSPTHQEVWASEAGQTTMKLLATSNTAMPLTRGLVWMTDVHYNAGKSPGTQETHTFAWDNFGFDGPILGRDLGFGVLDNSHNGTSGGAIGYKIPFNGTLTLSVTGVHNVETSDHAFLEYTWWPHGQDSITYALNGRTPHTVPWPYGSNATFKSATLAIPIALSELQNGTNTIVLRSSDSGGFGGLSVANVDIILAPLAGAPAPTAIPPTAVPPTIVPPTVVPPTSVPPTSVPPTAVPAIPTATSIPATPVSTTCSVIATRNGVDTRYTRPVAFCTDQ